MTKMLALLCLFPLVAAAEPGFSVSLTALGEKKIMVIKEVRSATGLGLAETKKLVESPTPVLIKGGLTRVQASALARALTDAGASAAIAADGTTIETGPPSAPGPGTFAVKLESYGQAKIACIKVLKDATAMGLKEAKELVESAPAVMKNNLTRAQAEKMVADFNAAGGKASLVSP
jgi:large subunit ribosomal protein L7/L12